VIVDRRSWTCLSGRGPGATGVGALALVHLLVQFSLQLEDNKTKTKQNTDVFKVLEV
jgi:hypothetical protein